MGGHYSGCRSLLLLFQRFIRSRTAFTMCSHFLYFLPIILFVYVYPNRGVIFSVAISAIFLLLVYYFAFLISPLLASLPHGLLFLSLLALSRHRLQKGSGLRRRKYRGIFENSQAGIFTFDIRIHAYPGDEWESGPDAEI